MTRAYLLIGAAALIVPLFLLGAAGAAYWAFWTGRASAPAEIQSAAPPADAAGARKVLYWYDPMQPQQRFDKPGKSPFMDMALVPKYADEGADEGSIRIDPALTQNLGLRLAAVETGKLVETIEAPGTVKFNERDVTIVQARSAGFVERAHGRAPGDIVKKGAPLADLLFSEWAGAQIEYIALLKMQDRELATAARERLMLLGMSEDLIRAVERARQPRLSVTIRSPADGVITSLGVRAGMNVMAGEMLAEITGFTPIWLEVQVPEADAQGLRPGQTVTAEFPAFPGESLRGKIAVVLPEANADTRTARVRIELPNPDGKLRPGQFARVTIQARESAEALLIPSEAVIRTGQRALVMVSGEEGRYRPTQITLGRESGGRIEVLEGLRAGQQVVASGQFLIDSEASIRGVLGHGAASGPVAAAAPAATAPLHEGEGTVESVESGQITLTHGPIETLNWGEMTMEFRLERADLAAGVKPGDRVRFSLRRDDSGFTIETLTKEARNHDR